MKLALNFLLFLFAFLTFDYESFSLSDYEIKKVCRKEKYVLSCIKYLQKRRFNLQKGNLIEIPVIPHKR